MKKFKFLYALILSCPFILHAQDAQPDTTISLDKVVISVNKSEESSRGIPQQIEMITSAQIQSANAQSSADLLAATGLVHVQKSQMGGGSPVLRGFEANRILLVIDGVRMNNLIYRGGHLQNVISTDQNIMDHVDLLFGPTSTVYGSDALGGAIVFYTRKPMLNSGDGSGFKANAMMRTGSVNNEMTGHVDFNFGNSKIASLTSITYSKFGDLRTGKNLNPFYQKPFGERPYYQDQINGNATILQSEDRFLQTATAFNQYDLLQKILFKPGEKTTHLLNLQFSNSTDVPRYDRLTDPDADDNGVPIPNTLNSSEWYYGPQTRMLGAYDVNHYLGGGFFKKVNAIFSYQNLIESRHNRNFGSSSLNHRTETVNVAGYTIGAEGRNKQHTLRLGIDGQYSTVKSEAEKENIKTGEISPLDTRYPDGDNSMMHNAVYVTHNWKISDGIYLNDGFRFGNSSLRSNQIDTTFFKLPESGLDQNNMTWSGSVGMAASPNKSWKITLLWSSGFRVPNIDDMSKVFESQAGSVVVPNHELKPERTSTFELGITRAREGHFTWENTFYYTDFFDAIVMDKFQFNGQDSIIYDDVLSAVYASQNKGKAYLWGFSSILNAALDEHFSATASLLYTYGRIREDSSEVPLDHIPPSSFRTSLKYTNTNCGGEFFASYNSWKRLKDYNPGGEDNEQYATAEGMPAWFTLNLRGWVKVKKYLTVQAGIDNILDTQYRTFASGINAPGRNFFGALRVNV